MTEEELRDLIERAHQAREQAPGPMYRDAVEFFIAKKQREVLGGSITDLERYKQATGWIQGALFALNVVDELDQQVNTARELLRGGGDAA